MIKPDYALFNNNAHFSHIAHQTNPVIKEQVKIWTNEESAAKRTKKLEKKQGFFPIIVFLPGFLLSSPHSVNQIYPSF